MNWNRILSLRAAHAYFRHCATQHVPSCSRARLQWPLGSLLLVLITLTSPWSMLLSIYSQRIGLGVSLLGVLLVFLGILAVLSAAEPVTRHLPYSCSLAQWISYRLEKKELTFAITVASALFQFLLLIVLATRFLAAVPKGQASRYLAAALLLGGVGLWLWCFRNSSRLVSYLAALFVLCLIPLLLNEYTTEAAAELRGVLNPFFNPDLQLHERWLVMLLIVFATPCFLGFDSRYLQAASAVRRSRLFRTFLLAGGLVVVIAPAIVFWLQSPSSNRFVSLVLTAVQLLLYFGGAILAMQAFAADCVTLTLGFDDGFRDLHRVARNDSSNSAGVDKIFQEGGSRGLVAVWAGVVLAFLAAFLLDYLPNIENVEQDLLVTALILAATLGPPVTLSLWRWAPVKHWGWSLVFCLVALVVLWLSQNVASDTRHYFVIAGLGLLAIAWLIPPWQRKVKWNSPLDPFDDLD